jgi:hypothetical protein
MKIEIPHLALKMNGRILGSRIGRQVAKDIRARWKDGRGASAGLPMPRKRKRKRKGVVRPMIETRALMNSIKYRATKRYSDRKRGIWGYVYPRGNRKDSGSRQATVLYSQIHTRAALKASDPMGVTTAIQEAAVKVAQAEITRQVQRKIAGIQAKRRP